jgi:hypothetical protein
MEDDINSILQDKQFHLQLKSEQKEIIQIRKTADLPLQPRVSTFPRFVAIGFYFLSETLI